MINAGADKDAVVNLVTSTWDRLKRERLPKEMRWNECRLAAESEFGQTWKELANYRSKRYIPISSMALNNVSSKFCQTLLPPDWFKAVGRTPDDESGAILMESLAKYQMDKVGLRAKLARLIYLICQYGNWPFSVKWRKDTITVPDSQGMEQAMQGAIGEDGTIDMKSMALPRKEVVLYEGPDVVLGDLFGFVVERNPDDDLYFTRINRFYRTKEYLEATAEPDEYGNVQYEGIDELVNETRYRETSDNYKRQSDVATGILTDETNAVEILEMWGNFHLRAQDGTTQSFKNFRAVVGNRRVLMAFEENPYAHGRVPWNLGQFGAAGDHTYAYGILEQNLGLQDDVNVRSNQIIDAHSLSINQIWKYKDDGVIDPDNLISAPGTMIQVQDLANVVPIQFSDFTQQGMGEVAFMLDQFNRSTGAQLPMLEQKSGGSATQSAITAQASQSKEVEIAKHIEYTVLRPILEQWFALNQQLLDDDQTIRVAGDAVTQGITDPDTGMRIEPTGPITLKISPDQIAGQFDVHPVGVSEMASSQEEVSNLMQFFQIMTQGPLANYLKPAPLITALARRFKIYDAWQFVKTEQEIQIEQQQAAMAAAMQGPAGPNGPGAGGPPNAGPGPTGGGVPTLPGSSNVANRVPDGVEPGQRTGPMALPG
jgi:hypothetical protein